jgi:SAM-dependent methyltransferase
MYTQARITDEGEPPPSAELLRQVSGHWGAQALWVFASLGIADLLKDGPQTTASLAAQTRIHEPSLYRLLRALAARGVVTEQDGRRFELGALGTALRSDVPGSLRVAVLMFAAPWFWRAWGELLHTVKTGEPAFDHVFGMPLFQYLGQDAGAAALFDAGMTVLSAPVIAAVVEALDLSPYQRVVDVGGGQGALVSELLRAHRHLRGVVFDLPTVIEGARAIGRGADGVEERLEFVRGSFFDSVPEGGDVYILKSVLHNWSDAAAEEILRNCRRAMKRGGALVVVERVLPPRVDTSLAAQAMAMSDLQMMVVVTGRERTEEEFSGVLARAGFTLEQVIPTSSAFSMLMAR